ncbi:hypothetical protein [Brevundimonas sp. CEF1]|uniref:hypothetical protein n=1 Tax=Brevundimonas sp. CEF1 TaxID=3442642 RepID=UPI000FBDB344
MNEKAGSSDRRSEPYRAQARDLLRADGTNTPVEFRFIMTRSSRVSELRQLQLNAEHMARLSPFQADRDRFAGLAERYRKEADALEMKGEDAPVRGRSVRRI